MERVLFDKKSSGLKELLLYQVIFSTLILGVFTGILFSPSQSFIQNFRYALWSAIGLSFFSCLFSGQLLTNHGAVMAAGAAWFASSLALFLGCLAILFFLPANELERNAAVTLLAIAGSFLVISSGVIHTSAIRYVSESGASVKKIYISLAAENALVAGVIIGMFLLLIRS